MTTVEVVEAPVDGVWRVGRSPDPLAPSSPLEADDLNSPKTGNRFDSQLGTFRVLYFATDLRGCFGEVLARFRPDVELLAVIGDEWADLGFMEVGDVPASWRQRRTAVRVGFPPDPDRFTEGVRFLDVESGETREALRVSLAPILAYYGYDDLDSAVVHGQDRRITRWISQWAYDAHDESGRPSYAGIHYKSRLDPEWECWAVFDDVSIEEYARQPILASDEALQEIAKRYSIRVY